eukprot:2892649-Rhodomonas_salina.1
MAYRIWTGGVCSALAAWFLTFSFGDSSSEMSSGNLSNINLVRCISCGDESSSANSCTSTLSRTITSSL